MRMVFERSALSLIALLVIGLSIAAWHFPPQSAVDGGRYVQDTPNPATHTATAYMSSAGIQHDADETPESLFAPNPAQSANALDHTFERLGYDFDLVLKGRTGVPRILVASLPPDLHEIRETKVRKAIFFRTILPLVLKANEEILNDRKRLWRLHFEQRMNLPMEPEDRLWLDVMRERYRVKSEKVSVLLRHVDVIPPSLALAQAAEESGWGTSRFVKEGNAIFGQWTFSEEARGLVPKERDEGKTHKIRAFDSLLDSVRAYIANLNTHRAYRKMRAIRAAMRRAGIPISGLSLAEELTSYSERGEEYVKSIRSHIRVNNLDLLDGARLDGDASAKPWV